MKRLLALMLLYASPHLFGAPHSIPAIIRLDPQFDAIVPRDARVEKIADGFAWTEGPVWNRASTSLLFSDVPNNVIREWRPGAGPRDFLKPSGYFGTTPFSGREPGSNGLAFDQQGRLVFAQHGERSISRRESDMYKVFSSGENAIPFGAPTSAVRSASWPLLENR